MAHAIFGNRFASLRQPAWHNLGTVFQDPFTATEALHHMGGYDVVALPVAPPADFPDMVVPYKHIYRLPTTDSPAPVSFGVVGIDYTLITPADFAEVWDSAVSLPVETIGALKDGRIMFISTKLPAFDVKGDEVENYMLAVNGMDGSRSAAINVTPVRVVCQNTLSVAERVSTETYRIVHDEYAKVKLAEWLATVQDRAIRTAEALREAFNVLASTKVSKTVAEKVVIDVYPDVRAPRNNAPPAVIAAREALRVADQKTQMAKREASVEGFLGAATGSNTKAFKGTAWGLYNAVVEVEDYRRYAQSATNAAYDAVWGLRADAKQRAFDQLMTIAAGKAPAATAR
jgi:phage/plasmid-like protein (TIGR03299 family)